MRAAYPFESTERLHRDINCVTREELEQASGVNQGMNCTGATLESTRLTA